MARAEREHRKYTLPASQIRFKGMKKLTPLWQSESGKLGWIFLWLIGVPIPVLLILFLLRGCT